MRIGVFIGGSIPSYFAHSFNVMKMAKGFMELGHEVEVVTADSLKVKWLKRKITEVKSHYGVPDQTKITWLSPSLKSFLTNRTSGDDTYCRRAAEYAQERCYDMVFCRSFLIPYYTAKMGLPTVVETHTVNYSHPDLQKVFQVGDLVAFKGLVTIHKSIGEEHIKRGVPKEKILVLEDGVDLDRFEIEDDPIYWKKQLHLDLGKKYVVYCGHLYADKGIEVILEAAKILEKNNDLIFLLVGGFKSDRKYWEKYCRAKEINNVIFIGHVANSLVPAYLKAADGLMLPYKMDMTHEIMDINTTSPLKLFEYMAARRPIVATNIPTVAKILKDGENALLAEPSTADFANKIEQCICMNKGEQERLGTMAYRSVIDFSWSNRCEKILELC